MSMTSRERLLCALDNKRPDRLPCQVHGWIQYYLDTYLDGIDWYEANARTGMDYAIYVSPDYTYTDEAQANWRWEHRDLGTDAEGNHRSEGTVHTPSGTLHCAHAQNKFTGWCTEHLIKTEEDFEIWNAHYPVPTEIDFTNIQTAHDRLGDKGIVRSHPFSPGQGSPWQSWCTMLGTEEAIYAALDEPEWTHHVLEAICQKTERVLVMWDGTPADMVEVGGGAGSSTVISPEIFREVCLPYDIRQNKLLHDAGLKVVYHLCGGLMPMLDLVKETGADGLETMTPPSMGGDCDLAAASRQVGADLFFIGGFDQNAGFEHGTPESVREQVLRCFDATRDHAGYIIAPSDHFFFGAVENLQAFSAACRECVY